MSELNDYVRDDLFGALAPEQVAEIATQLDTDDAVAIIEDMEEDDQQAVLEALHPEDRAAIEDALSYPEESAGRLMQRDLVAVPEYITVGQEIGRAHVCTPVTNAQLVCPLLHDKKNQSIFYCTTYTYPP